MATEQQSSSRSRRRRGRHRLRDPDGHRQPHRQDLRAADHGRHDPRRWTCARSRSTRTTSGCMSYDPAFTNTASCRSRDHLHRRRRGRSSNTAATRSSSSASTRTYLEVAYLLIFGELPTAGPARALGLRHHPPHLRPRGHQAALRGLPLRRPPDGDAARRRSARSRPSTRTPSRSTTRKSATWRRSG